MVSEPQQDGTAYPAPLRNDERNVRSTYRLGFAWNGLDLPPKRDQLDYSSARNAFILPRRADHRMEKGLEGFLPARRFFRSPWLFLPSWSSLPLSESLASTALLPFSDARAFQGGGVTSEPNPFPSSTLVTINFPLVFQRSAQFLTRSGELYHDDHVFASLPALPAPLTPPACAAPALPFSVLPFSDARLVLFLPRRGPNLCAPTRR